MVEVRNVCKLHSSLRPHSIAVGLARLLNTVDALDANASGSAIGDALACIEIKSPMWSKLQSCMVSQWIGLVELDFFPINWRWIVVGEEHCLVYAYLRTLYRALLIQWRDSLR